MLVGQLLEFHNVVEVCAHQVRHQVAGMENQCRSWGGWGSCTSEENILALPWQQPDISTSKRPPRISSADTPPLFNGIFASRMGNREDLQLAEVL